MGRGWRRKHKYKVVEKTKSKQFMGEEEGGSRGGQSSHVETSVRGVLFLLSCLQHAANTEKRCQYL